MNDNAEVYDQVADLLEKNPLGVLDLGEDNDMSSIAPGDGR